MAQLKFGRYLGYLALITFSLLLLVGVINWFVNPYGIYDPPAIEGFNKVKGRNAISRIGKAYAVRKIKPCAICLGTSTAMIGINPDYVGWACTPVYNLGIEAASIYEITRYMQHANAILPLKEVVLMLDFMSFRVPIETMPGFEEERLSIKYGGQKQDGLEINDALASLLSLEVLNSSINTVVNQTNAEVIFSQNGMENPTAAYFKGGPHAAFLASEMYYMENVYIPKQYPFEDTKTNCASLDYYRKILRLAYQDDINLYLCISPYHVRQWEALSAVGLWPQFENWKRILVMINEEEALRAGKSPFPLWDFSIYNEFTEEGVPPLGNDKTMMRWYWDSSHYKKELGDILLDRIFDGVNIEGAPYNDFGVPLTSKNIDEHLLKIRNDRQYYRETHPDDIAEIEDSAVKVGKLSKYYYR